MSSVSPDTYLARVGASRPARTDAKALRALQRAHLFHVPFENLDIHRGVRIELDTPRILDKIVTRRRGGFCYELNAAFAWLLQELGFEVQLLSANVAGMSGESLHWGIDFDHMLLRVDLDEPWIADVGFGDNFLDPLRLIDGVVDEQAIGTFRLVRQPDYWVLERRNESESEFTPQYRFVDQPHALADFQPGCTFHQSPESHFSHGTICSLATASGRKTLRSDRLIVTSPSGKTVTPVEDESAWKEALMRHFGVILDA